MRKIIAVNGPPRAGKDTIANFLEAEGYRHLRFKDKLFEDTAEEFGVSLEWFMDGYDENKEIPMDLLGGLSKRQALIYTSEEVIKKKFSSFYYGESVAEKIKESDGNIVISDSGFVDEFMALKNAFPQDCIVLIKVFRQGKTFEGDSRNYLPAGITENIIHVHNDGSLDDLKAFVFGALEELR